MHTSALTLSESERWTRIGALSALAMLLGYLETFVPIPIPGVKLGLANVAVLIALAEGDVWGACWVGVVKVLAAGLLFGSPVTMAYSAAGTLLSLLVMAPLSRLRTMSMWMVFLFLPIKLSCPNTPARSSSMFSLSFIFCQMK